MRVFCGGARLGSREPGELVAGVGERAANLLR
jgi:hypothetical protein